MTSKVLESSVHNAEALWRAFAAVRGHQVIDEPGWLAVDAGGDAGGTRVILRRAVTGAAQRALLNRLVEGASRPVVVEDPFGTTDLHAQGLVPRALSVMAAGPLAGEASPPDAVPSREQPGITVRRAGIGRALMLAAMQELAGLPMVLCATSQGAPLYRKLGFETALETTYWQPREPA